MANNEQALGGRCTCGEIEYRLLQKPMFVHCCHCTWCQRETGSAFAVNGMIEADQVELVKGEPVCINTPSSSGSGQQIFRCPTCQVALWSCYSGAGAAIRFVRVGTLASPDECPPDIHIFTSTKQDWVRLPDEVPAVPEYYQRSLYWPAKSIARREAVLAR